MNELERFSEIVLEEYSDPYGMETLFDPDGYALVKGSCGDTLEVFLKAEGGDRKLHMAFRTDGCVPTIACGSMLSKLVKNRTVEEAEAITEEELVDALGGLPEDHLHCAALAVDALFKAILDLEFRASG